MGYLWLQLDHMRIICTSLQTDNHASTYQLVSKHRSIHIKSQQIINSA